MPIDGSGGGGARDTPTSRSNSFHFHALFDKINRFLLQTQGLVSPTHHLGNSGSATRVFHNSRLIRLIQQNKIYKKLLT